MTHEFRHERRVEFADTDCAGIIHFSRFACYAEEAEHAFLRSLGLSVQMKHEGHTIGFPRLASRFEYSRPIRFEDVVDIRLRVVRLGASTVTYQFLFEKDGDEVARGEFTVIACRVYPEGRIEKTALPNAFTDLVEIAPEGALDFRER